jgi:hypothetical protein
MIDIVVDFSKREGYLLQPTKSVVLPVKSKCKSMEINEGFWKLNDCNMPIVTQASHIGISATSSAQVGAQQLILPICSLSQSMSNNGFIYTLYKSALSVPL